MKSELYRLFNMFFVLVLLAMLFVGPSNAEPTAEDYYNSGISYAEDGKLDPAITALEKAIELKPDYIGAVNALGTVYFEKGENNLALMTFDRALELDERYAITYYNMGIFFTAEKQYSMAILFFEKAIEAKPNFGDSYNNLAFVCYLSKDFEKAEQHIEKALHLGTKVKPEFIAALKASINPEKTRD